MKYQVPEGLHQDFLTALTEKYAGTAVDHGYKGVTHAGIAVIAADTGRVLLAQRAFDETDDPSVAETYEFPGGSLNPDEDPLDGALREFQEEMGQALLLGDVIDGWRGGDDPETGHYQGFVYQVAEEFPLQGVPTDEVQAAGWFDSDEVQSLESGGMLRPEIVATMDWSLVFPETAQGADMTTEDVDTTDYSAVFEQPIPIHGVIAPEETETGDKRGFEAGSMTSRMGRLPFRWAESDIGAHDGAIAIGSVDRMMRSGGLIYWEGLLMNSPKADDFAAVMQFFGGRYGVSVDGDKGSLNMARTEETGTTWFEQVRAAGLTAVDIPAFQEAYVAFGLCPGMPASDEVAAALTASGDFVTFGRGPGWVTDPKATNRIHDYWTKPGQPGFVKVGWGTPGDFTRAKALIGAKIAEHSPDKTRFLNQIIAQWHFDALGYWPGDLGKPGNAPNTPENRRRAAEHADAAADGIELELDTDAEDTAWEAVLTSSANGRRVLPPLEYFHKHPDSYGTVIEDPDENGFMRTYGYAAEWGVCHIGHDNRCVEPPRTYSDDYPDFHKGRMKTRAGSIPIGVLTYNVEHRDAKRILSESATQSHFDNLKNAWAAVRVGEDENGIWFSGIVLPKVDEDDLVKIAASGQVSGEWKYGSMRALLTVNVEGFGVTRATAEYDAQGNVLALAASAFNNVLTASANGVENSPCSQIPTPWKRIQALRQIDAEIRLAVLRAEYLSRKAR